MGQRETRCNERAVGGLGPRRAERTVTETDTTTISQKFTLRLLPSVESHSSTPGSDEEVTEHLTEALVRNRPAEERL